MTNQNQSTRHQQQDHDLENLIGDIKKSYKKSNLKDIDAEVFATVAPEERIGYLLKNIPSSSRKEFSMNFDPVETIFMQKLVSERTMEKRIVLRMEDYFKGIVFIDYFSKIITSENGFTDELFNLSQELENINPLLDPDMGMLTRYAGIYYVSNVKKKYFLKPQKIHENSRRRYRQTNHTIEEHFTNIRKLDPFYDSLGKKVYGLLENQDIKEQAKYFSGLNDLKALIFVDSILPFLEKEKYKKEIIAKVKAGDYYQASIKAISYISNEVANKPLDEYFNELQKLDPGSSSGRSRTSSDRTTTPRGRGRPRGSTTKKKMCTSGVMTDTKLAKVCSI